MGMAASQARYLALTARKTNTEWEGQQINQARTALANQSANLFNRLLGLEVPNPPKTTDYTELQYSYSDGDNESVIDSWEQIGTKNPDYNYVVKHYYMADVYTGAKKLLNDPQVQIGNVLKEMQYSNHTTKVEKDADGNLTVTYKINGIDNEQTYEKLSQDKVDSDEKLKKDLTNFETAKNLAKADGTLNTDAVFGYQDSDGTWHFFVANDYTKITQDAVDSDDVLKKAITDFETKNHLLNFADDSLNLNNIYGYQDDEGTWHFTVEAQESGSTITKAYDNIDYSSVIGPSYIGNSKLTELNVLINDEATGINQVTELAQILRDCPDSSISKYISFDEYGNLQYDGKGIYTFELYGKNYYTTEQDLQDSAGYPYDPLKPIEAQAKLAYYNASYISKRIEETNQALLETDGEGRFKTVRFDNDSVTYTLNVETVTNEAAYQDAMNQYLYKKEQYEKTIADINAKTSIIQQEDRTLELRLKQLDTEQLALKTEMEAVQKVIKDNVEKTFKTFSD